jgi:hypothetical protein
MNDLYSLPNIVRVKIEKNEIWGEGGYELCVGEESDVYRVLVGKSEGKMPLESPRRRWEDNIKMDIQEVGKGSWGLYGVGSL